MAGLLTGDEAAKTGLGLAYERMMNQTPLAYPEYRSSQLRGPAQAQYPEYSPNQPMATITAPNYSLSAQKAGWNQWTPQQGPTYMTPPTSANAANWSFQGTNPNAQTQGWSYQGIDPTAQVAGFNWKNTVLSSLGVNNQTAAAAPYSWQNANLGMQSVTNPYTAYSGNPNVQAAQINLPYNKFGASPQYQGLLGGDYDALQQALATPGQIAAQRAYEQGRLKLAEQMGAGGLYGSSVMANQARTALDTPYMETLAQNAANAAAQRYNMQAQDLQNKNQFGLNVYGQQMNENQAANQLALEIARANQGDIQARNNLAQQAWQQRVAENLAGGQMGLEAQQSNQNTYANLQNLLAQQGIAQNQAGLEYAKLATGVGQQNVANNLAAQQSNQQAQTALNQLLSQQGLAQNQAGLDYSKMLTDVNQQNVANRLAQSQQQNQLAAAFTQAQNDIANQNATRAMQQGLAQNEQGLNYANLLTGVNQQNIANALTQANQLNTLRSADTQQIQGLLSSQALAQNQYLKDLYGLDISREQDQNANAMQGAQLMATQNANLYQANKSDAERQQAYNLTRYQQAQQLAEATRQWENQQNYEKFQYDLARNAYQNQQNESLINQALALAGQGAPLSNAALNYQTAMQQLQAQQDMAEQQGIGQLAGGLLGAGGSIGTALALSGYFG